MRARCIFSGCQKVIASEIGHFFVLLWFLISGPRPAILICVCPVRWCSACGRRCGGVGGKMVSQDSDLEEHVGASLSLHVRRLVP